MQKVVTQGQGQAAEQAAGKRGGAGRFFIRGLGVILPSVLTLWILVTAFRFVDSNIAGPINAGIRLAVTAVAEGGALPQFVAGEDQIEEEIVRAERLRLDTSRGAASWRATRLNIDAWWEARWYLDLAGLVLAIVAVYVLGRLVGGYLGRRPQNPKTPKPQNPKTPKFVLKILKM